MELGRFMSRLDKWLSGVQLKFTGVVHPDKNPDFVSAWEKLDKTYRPDHEKPSEWDLIQACRELIFDLVGDQIVIHAIVYAIDANTALITITPLFDIECDTTGDVLRTLALAEVCEVPVYPNTEDLSRNLLSYFDALHRDGFPAKDEFGNFRRLILKKSSSENFDNIDILKANVSTDFHQPIKFLRVSEISRQEIARFEYAKNILEG